MDFGCWRYLRSFSGELASFLGHFLLRASPQFVSNCEQFANGRTLSLRHLGVPDQRQMDGKQLCLYCLASAWKSDSNPDSNGNAKSNAQRPQILAAGLAGVAEFHPGSNPYLVTVRLSIKPVTLNLVQ